MEPELVSNEVWRSALAAVAVKMVPAIMSPKESPDRTKKVKKERAASAPKRNKGTSTVKRLPAESNGNAEPPAGVKGKLELNPVKVKEEQKDLAETDSNLGRLQPSSSLKLKTEKPEESLVKAIQEASPETTMKPRKKERP